MATAPEEFTLESVKEFMIEKGGKVTNHELVKHFKRFLTDPACKEENRVRFKDFVNQLATIRQDEQEKFLVLKRKYLPPGFPEPFAVAGAVTSAVSPYSPSTSTISGIFNHGGSPLRAPPPYRPPPDPFTPSPTNSLPGVLPEAGPESPISPNYLLRAALPSSPSHASPSVYADPKDAYRKSIVSPTTSLTGLEDASPMTPQAPPRKKANGRNENKENSPFMPDADQETMKGNDTAEEVKLTVKERTQRFDRMASQSDLLGTPNGALFCSRRDFRNNKGAGDDDDTSSVTTMEPRAREWMLATAKGDYHVIARLLREESRLARHRDYVTGYTALHWAAKHGSADIVKLLAGTYKADVNMRTNGGYAALHIAAQQDNEEVFDLLVKAYGADANIRDYSGKKPRQYFPRQDTVLSNETFRKISAKRSSTAEKDSNSFLRIGSLNVRVKKTTEAFNHLISGSIGMGSSNLADKLHKPWGSADNLQATSENSLMPPPKQAPAKKKRPKDWPVGLTGITMAPVDRPVSSPNVATAFSSEPIKPKMPSSRQIGEDSDSDSACGFGNDWHGGV